MCTKNRIVLLQTVIMLFVLTFVGCKKQVDSGNGTTDQEDEVMINTGLISTLPFFPINDQELKIQFNPAKGDKGLASVSGDLYVHIGVITTASQNSSDWRFVKTNWGQNTEETKMVRTTSGQYEIEINLRSFFAVPANEKILQIAFIVRNSDGSLVGRNEDGSDMFVPVYDANKLAVRIVSPEPQPTYTPSLTASDWRVGQQIQFKALISKEAEITCFINGQKKSQANGKEIIFNGKLEENGTNRITIRAVTTNETIEEHVDIFVIGEPQIAALPADAKPNGVTWRSSGATAIFALTAPEKDHVALIGDFNDWSANADYMLKKTPDGKVWWVEVTGLNPQQQYAYQFLVNGQLRLADPYAELVLDPAHDQHIPNSTFPNLKAYPTGKTTGIVSVTHANETTYSWKTTDFQRPHPHDLVIYEMHVRDFIQARNYKTLKDTLNYLSNLGINALQLMPVNEFEGNSSWGYNPSFYFAPDKYYGTKNSLKELIDECHQRGIAVILDVVLNHSFGQSPMVQLYAAQGEIASNNPWFNRQPTHPFNVGYDFNHESTLTKQFVKDVLKFWIEEYKIDGFRFDLSKGFTQKNSGTGDHAVGAWSAKDPSRIAIWKDYNNFIRSVDATNYVILEHFADDEEEQELSAEGMMLWNNVNHSFNEATMGWLNDSDFSRLFHDKHGFQQPNLISYMESHDEERIMVKNLKYGNESASGLYSAKDLNTALKRVEMASAFLFTAPGPKMIWQFGELGYDKSIEENGRTGEKPILWNYNTGNRRQLYAAFSRFIKFKTKNDIYRTGDFTYKLDGAIKYIHLRQGNQEVLVIGNFDVIAQMAHVSSINVQGMWYDNIANENISLGSDYTKTLVAGEYYVYSKSPLNK